VVEHRLLGEGLEQVSSYNNSADARASGIDSAINSVGTLAVAASESAA